MNKNDEILILEKIKYCLDNKCCKEQVQAIIEPYSHLAYTINMLQELLINNQSLLCKRVVDRELENIKGITEQKCKKKNLKKDYCKICGNYYCKLNLNNKY